MKAANQAPSGGNAEKKKKKKCDQAALEEFWSDKGEKSCCFQSKGETGKKICALNPKGPDSCDSPGNPCGQECGSNKNCPKVEGVRRESDTVVTNGPEDISVLVGGS